MATQNVKKKLLCNLMWTTKITKNSKSSLILSNDIADSFQNFNNKKKKCVYSILTLHLKNQPSAKLDLFSGIRRHSLNSIWITSWTSSCISIAIWITTIAVVSPSRIGTTIPWQRWYWNKTKEWGYYIFDPTNWFCEI